MKRKSAFSSKLKSFIEDFVITSEQLNYPPLPAALEFDGESSYVDCGNDESLKITEAITVEAWVKNNDPNSDGIIVYRGGSYEEPGYCIWRFNSKIRVELQDESKRKIIVDTADVVLDDQHWHHVAFTWDTKDIQKKEIWEKDKEDDQDLWKIIAGICVYFDGEIIPIRVISPSEIINFDVIGSPRVNLAIGRSRRIEDIIDSAIGSLSNGSFTEAYVASRTRAKLRLELAHQYYFNGSITEVRLWNVARTHEQIYKNVQRRLSEQDSQLSTEDQYWSDLVGYWRLGEAVGNRAYNLAHKPKHENSHSPNVPSSFETPKFGLCLYGLSDYVDCGKLNYQKIEEEKITALTVEAWVQNMDEKSNGMIVHQGGGWYEEGFSIWRYKGKLRVELQNQRKKIVVDTEGEAILPDKEWHHIAFTWEKGSELKIYIDGENKNYKVSKDGNCKVFSEFSDSIGVPKVNLNIGRSQNYGRYFNGVLAEVRIWKTVRTQDQIKEYRSQQLEQEKIGQENWLNLVGYWPLDEEEGNRAVNLVSDSQYGLVYGGQWKKAYELLNENEGAYGVISYRKVMEASQYPALPLPFGLLFNESNYVECSFQDGEDKGQGAKITDSITVEAWIKHKFGNCSIVKCSDDCRYEYSIAWYEGKIRVKLQSGDEKTVVYTEQYFPNDHLWHHIAFTWGKDKQGKNSHEVAIYIDGRVQACVVEGKCKAIVSAMQTKNIGLFTGFFELLEKPLIIGCKESRTAYYNIAIAEIRLWNVAQTQDQIQKNMSRRLSEKDSDWVSEQATFRWLRSQKDSERSKQEIEKYKQEYQYWSNLVGYWRLDDYSEKTVFDQTSNKNHGTIVGVQSSPALW